MTKEIQNITTRSELANVLAKVVSKGKSINIKVEYLQEHKLIKVSTPFAIVTVPNGNDYQEEIGQFVFALKCGETLKSLRVWGINNSFLISWLKARNISYSSVQVLGNKGGSNE